MPFTSTTNVVCGLSFCGSQPDFEGFLWAVRFPPSSKLTPSLFQFDRMQDLPENHFRVSEASWVNIINYYYYYSCPQIVTKCITHFQVPNFRTNYGKHAFKIAIIEIREKILTYRSLRTIAKNFYQASPCPNGYFAISSSNKCLG